MHNDAMHHSWTGTTCVSSSRWRAIARCRPRHACSRSPSPPWATCLRERGCEETPAVLPPCPPGLKPKTIRETLRSAAGPAEEQKVLLVGQLRPQVTCTALACLPGQCCNVCNGEPVLAQGALSVGLTRAERPLVCHGDESSGCCTVDASGQTVVARGILRLVEPEKAELQDAELCMFGG
jgi:hypothetical protein